MNYENPAKLERATKWAIANGKGDDAEAIKAQYLALGGKMSGEEERSHAGPINEVVAEKAEEVKPVEKIVRRRRGQQ